MIFGLVDEMADDKVGVDLCDGKKKLEDMEGPSVRMPHSLNAQDSMLKVLVVINCMSKFKMSFKWPRVVKCSRVILSA